MRPTLLLVYSFVAWFVLGIIVAFFPSLERFFWFLGGFFLFSTVLDAGLLFFIPSPKITRKISKTFSLNAPHEVNLRVISQASFVMKVKITDHPPNSCETSGLPTRIVLDPESWVDVFYSIRPLERGDHHFQQPQALIIGRLGLLYQRRFVGEAVTIKVYPNFRSVMRFATLATEHRTNEMGIHLQRRRGQGTEFHQLREYRAGDSLRQIDWNAVSRRQVLISREYREEKHQRVVFLLDCGRRMRTKDGDISHFDHALNAIILMSYVALREGDSVGLMTFSGQKRWLPPVRGQSAIQHVLHTVYDLKTTTAPSDYEEALHRLALKQRRRALIVLVTNVRDETTTTLQRSLRILRKRHLVLIGSLKEPVLAEALNAPIHNLHDAFRYAGTVQYLDLRKRSHLKLGIARHFTTDVEPSELPIALVNKYLAIKRAGLL